MIVYEQFYVCLFIHIINFPPKGLHWFWVLPMINFIWQTFQNTNSNISAIALFSRKWPPERLCSCEQLCYGSQWFWNVFGIAFITCFSGFAIEFSLSLASYILFIAKSCSYSICTDFHAHPSFSLPVINAFTDPELWTMST